MRPLNQVYNQASSEEVNITPMLDVVFIMLIFFVVTATYVKEWGISVVEPSSNQGLSAASSIVVRVLGSGSVSINNVDVDIRAVASNLLQLRAERPHAKMVLAAEDDAKNGLVVAVLDASRTAGIYDVSFTEI